MRRRALLTCEPWIMFDAVLIPKGNCNGVNGRFRVERVPLFGPMTHQPVTLSQASILDASFRVGCGLFGFP